MSEKPNACSNTWGPGAQSAWAARCADGVAHIPVSGGVFLHINTQYKHTGSSVAVSGSPTPAARANADATMNAWSGLAHPVFGSPKIERSLKVNLASSLMFSRLFYATETWTSVPDAAAKILESVHTRIVRRIAGVWNSAKSADPALLPVRSPDEAVRRLVGIPSVQCHLQQRRLMHLARVMRSAPDTLRALLYGTGPNRQSKWASLVVADLRALQAFHKPKLDELPDPCADARPWMFIILEFPGEWKQIVSAFRYYESTLVPAQRSPSVFLDNGDVQNNACPSHWLPCSLCPAGSTRAFCNKRALVSHQVLAHGLRKESRLYIESGVCPACGHDYVTRLRAIEHASRSDVCSAALPFYPRLSNEKVEELDAADALQLKAARRQGHARPLASVAGPARGPKPPNR